LLISNTEVSTMKIFKLIFNKFKSDIERIYLLNKFFQKNYGGIIIIIIIIIHLKTTTGNKI
jgi:hypothetical protein